MSNVRFNLRDLNAEESPINLVYRFNHDRLVYSTGKKMNPKYWDKDRMRATRSKHFKLSSSINSTLDKLERYLLEIEAEANRANIELTKKYLKEELDRKLNRKEDKGMVNFNAFIDLYIAEKALDPTRAKESIKVYNTFRKHFNAFCGAKRYQFYEVTTEVMTSFLEYMKNKKKDGTDHYSDNQINKVLSTGKTIIKEAHDRGFLTKVDLQSKRLSHSKRPADNIYLTREELAAICKIDYSSNKTFDETRDLFVVGCFTGLRYSDYSQIKKENLIDLTNGKGKVIGKGLKTFTEKQKEKVIIPLNNVVKAILRKYEFQLPKGISNQKTNEILKEIAQISGIVTPTEKVIYRNTKPISEILPKYELVSSHTARRSFATNAYKAGVPAISIMKITGHHKTETFMKYIKITEEENAVLMVGHEFFR